ncbi:MAG: DUF2905 domain-containing protein [Armatimonadetes bacterium]|nr:DUF2905 domain-containing protein [Armatimonadota bacterium]
MGKALILVGLGVALLGLAVMGLEALFRSTGGRTLPGDIYIRRGNFTFYFPIATCLLLSAVLTLALWLARYFKR